MSSSVHVNNRTKNILVLGKEYAEKLYSINFNKTNTKFCLSFHYHGANSYLFVNDTEIIKFKAQDSNIVTNPLCLGNISKDIFCR